MIRVHINPKLIKEQINAVNAHMITVTIIYEDNFFRYSIQCFFSKRVVNKLQIIQGIPISSIDNTVDNTIPYNHSRLPFLVNPIIESNNYFYNGIDSYQGLLALKDGKTEKAHSGD